MKEFNEEKYIVQRVIKCYGVKEYLTRFGGVCYETDFLNMAARFDTIEDAETAAKESKDAFGYDRPWFECEYSILKLCISLEQAY